MINVVAMGNIGYLRNNNKKKIRQFKIFVNMGPYVGDWEFQDASPPRLAFHPISSKIYEDVAYHGGGIQAIIKFPMLRFSKATPPTVFIQFQSNFMENIWKSGYDTSYYIYW